MKLKTVGIVLAGILATPAWASAPATKVNFRNDQDKVSYAIGLQIGSDFKQQGITINPALFNQGLVDGTTGAAPQLSQQQLQDTMNAFRQQIIAKKQAEFKAVSDTNKTQGTKFLAENKTKPGVVTLPDGLQYKVIKAGTGVQPKEGDTITVNYEGRFVDGKTFDSSYQRNKPAQFTLSKDLVPAWVEALKMMKAGSTWEIYAPASLGYGDRGIGPIGPNQTLVFKIELISVTPKK